MSARTSHSTTPLLVASCRAFADHLSPVLAYRRLVAPDARTAPSLLLESVEQGGVIGRYSVVAAQPAMTVTARGHQVTILDHRTGSMSTSEERDPLEVPRRLTRVYRPCSSSALPATFVGGWGGTVSFDAVRWLEPKALSFQGAPPCDRGTADLALSQYRTVAVFDHLNKSVEAIAAVPADEAGSEDAARLEAHAAAERLMDRLCHGRESLEPGRFALDLGAPPAALDCPTFADADFRAGVERCQEYIRAGDAFQIVLSRRFERWSGADPFDVYRALRVVNPSPYQAYIQTGDAILVAGSPEILCRTRGRALVNRPLAGTRPRGRDADSDRAHEADLLADTKERAEHAMLVDLGRNDLARVAEPHSVVVESCMDVERYSHVMHLSSTVTATLRGDLDSWDALRATLPVGTVSGAPKVRAIQIIDELEPVRRGAYAGALGVVGWNGDMDMAITLRTMVVPASMWGNDRWRYDLQAGAGVVLDSRPQAEADETRQKAAALGRAIELAEAAFTRVR
ncbi:MAG: chorismate-binding protein [Planctomycetota bacterium]|nr:chorismate-binding protein [Planctomycetota bacterium]MDA1105746.1 chorismate-binding protein [Planctomycetota bacterium]